MKKVIFVTTILLLLGYSGFCQPMSADTETMPILGSNWDDYPTDDSPLFALTPHEREKEGRGETDPPDVDSKSSEFAVETYEEWLASKFREEGGGETDSPSSGFGEPPPGPQGGDPEYTPPSWGESKDPPGVPTRDETPNPKEIESEASEDLGSGSEVTDLTQVIPEPPSNFETNPPQARGGDIPERTLTTPPQEGEQPEVTSINPHQDEQSEVTPPVHSQGREDGQLETLLFDSLQNESQVNWTQDKSEPEEAQKNYYSSSKPILEASSISGQPTQKNIIALQNQEIVNSKTQFEEKFSSQGFESSLEDLKSNIREKFSETENGLDPYLKEEFQKNSELLLTQLEDESREGYLEEKSSAEFLETDYSEVDLSLDELDFSKYYPSLESLNLSTLWQEDLSKLGNLEDAFSNWRKFLELLSPQSLMKEIAKRLKAKGKHSKRKLLVPESIPLVRFIILFLSLSIFCSCFGYSAGMYFIRSRR